MSKFFNETQKASQLTQKQSENEELDIRQILESLKEGTTSAAREVADVRLDKCRKVRLGGDGAPLILLQDDTTKIALEAYSGLRTRLMQAQGKSKVRSIALSSAFPHEGKTLTVMNLGLCYAHLSDQRVLIIDGDLRTGGLTHLMGNPRTAGLAEVLAGKASPNEVILATNQENLFAVPAGSVSEAPPGLFNSPRWPEFIGWCTKTFSVVLVDTPPILPLTDFELLSAACDGIVMVVRAGLVECEMLQKAAARLDSKKLLGVILNGADHDMKQYYGYDY